MQVLESIQVKVMGLKSPEDNIQEMNFDCPQNRSYETVEKARLSINETLTEAIVERGLHGTPSTGDRKRTKHT